MTNALWDSCLESLRVLLSEQDITTWFNPLDAVEEDNLLVLFAPNAFVAKTVKKNYLATIELVVKKYQSNYRVEVREGSAPTLFDAPRRQSKQQKPDNFAGKLNPEFTFSTFVEGDSNQIAANSALGVANKPNGTFNPLLIYGSTGLGKSHLMHAIGNHIKSQQPNKKIVFQTAEQFFVEMLNAMAESREKINRLKTFYRSVDVLLLDDVQFLAGKDKTQEEFFHLFNTLSDKSSQIVLTCDKYPKDVEGLEKRLTSRFAAGLSVAVVPPDLETRAAILKKKATLIEFDLDDKVAFYIAERVQSHVRDLEGALNSVFAMSQFSNQPATIELARIAIKDLTDSTKRQINIDNIQKTVASYYRIPVADLKSRSRKASLVRQRQMAMSIAKQLTGLSLPDIGDAFERDHTTVIHAIKKIEELKKDNPQVREDWANLTTTLNS